MARLGLHTFAVAPEWRPEEAENYLPEMIDYGVSVMEIPLLRPAEFDAKGTRKIAEKFGIGVTCSLGLPNHFDIVERPEEARDFLLFALEAAHDAGSPMLSGVTYGSIGRVSGAPPTEIENEAMCTLLAAASKKAAQLGMRVGLEPCNRYETHLLNSAAQTRTLIERIGVDNLFIHLDTYHMNLEENGLANGIVDAGSALGYIHLSESNRGVPGTGNIAWSEVFRGLTEIGYDGDFVVESFVKIHPDIAGGLAVWRPVAKNPADVIAKGLPFLVAAAAEAGITFEKAQ